ncbi:unnamed protein product [Orchesella dallaii]|uniref:C2H2-type domain-containing protein n=1 Tax=Orchesella dallaii TaxID=48710 RepID=A0ABP1R4F0_9HEXA
MRQRIQNSVITGPSASTSASCTSKSQILEQMNETNQMQNDSSSEISERTEIYRVEPCSSASSTFIPCERPSSNQQVTENECFIVNNEGQDETFSHTNEVMANSNKKGWERVIPDVQGGNPTSSGLLQSQIKTEIRLCGLTLTVHRKVVPGKATPLMKMRCHVREANKDKMRKTKSKTKRMLLTCPQCPEKFRGKYSLREHKKSHGFQCDICGRPIPGNSTHNLLDHKFSHKNDEERRAALHWLQRKN